MSFDRFQFWKSGKVLAKAARNLELQASLNMREAQERQEKESKESKEEEKEEGKVAKQKKAKEVQKKKASVIRKGLVILVGMWRCESEEHKEEITKDVKWLKKMWKESYGYDVKSNLANGSNNSDNNNNDDDGDDDDEPLASTMQLTMSELNALISKQCLQLQQQQQQYDGLILIWSTLTAKDVI
ncbi:hypothetical protein RFI_18487, partial [Reticulomyxa filosa]